MYACVCVRVNPSFTLHYTLSILHTIYTRALTQLTHTHTHTHTHTQLVKETMVGVAAIPYFITFAQAIAAKNTALAHFEKDQVVNTHTHTQPLCDTLGKRAGSKQTLTAPPLPCSLATSRGVSPTSCRIAPSTPWTKIKVPHHAYPHTQSLDQSNQTSTD